jgi:phenylacetate-CoA ligase
MHALAIIYILRAIEGIAEFKFIQHSLDLVEVIFVTNVKWHPNATTIISTELKKRLGEHIQVQMNEVEKIPAEASGKYRYVVSHVSLPHSLATF